MARSEPIAPPEDVAPPVMIEVYDGGLEPESLEACRAGYRAALGRHGLGSVAAGEPSPAEAGAVYVVLVRLVDGGAPVGGLWVRRLSARHPFSHLDDLRVSDPGIDAVFEGALDGGMAQMGGGWLDHAWTGRGVFGLLALGTSCAASGVGISRLIALAHSQSFRGISVAGFRRLEHLGDGGAFPYPDPRYRSVVCVAETTRTEAVSPAWHAVHREAVAGAPQVIARGVGPTAVAARIHLAVRPFRETLRPPGEPSVGCP